MAARKSFAGRKYGNAAAKSVESAMKRKNKGTLRSGSKPGRKVTSRKQAIAIGLSEARAKGAKVPRKSVAKKSSGRKSQIESRPAENRRPSQADSSVSC